MWTQLRKTGHLMNPHQVVFLILEKRLLCRRRKYVTWPSTSASPDQNLEYGWRRRRLLSIGTVWQLLKTTGSSADGRPPAVHSSFRRQRQMYSWMRLFGDPSYVIFVHSVEGKRFIPHRLWNMRLWYVKWFLFAHSLSRLPARSIDRSINQSIQLLRVA